MCTEWAGVRLEVTTVELSPPFYVPHDEPVVDPIINHYHREDHGARR
jgi:hypothetical protein